MYDVIAKGGPNGKFLYIRFEWGVSPVDTTSSPLTIEGNFPRVPTVKNFAEAESVLNNMLLEEAADLNW